MTQTTVADVVVVGAGPAGSVTAIQLAQHGLNTVIVEKQAFPRFHIGESMIGESAALLRTLGLNDIMEASGYPAKRGTKVFGPNGKNSFWIPVVGVGAGGERYDSTTWQVRRSKFDAMLLEEAQRSGATRIAGEARAPLFDAAGKVSGISYRDESGNEGDIVSEIVVDASGSKAFLHRAGVTGDKERGLYDKQIAIYTHVSGARRDPGDQRDNTLIFYQKPNHWAWFIPIDDDTVSVGVVVPIDYFKSCGESKTAFLEREFRELNSELADRVEDVRMLIEPQATSSYSYQIRDFAGPGFVCVGDSHRFIDPVFSFGVHFALFEAHFAAQRIIDHFEKGCPPGADPFGGYEDHVEAGQDVIQTLLDAFWLEPFGFAYAAHKVYRDEIIDFFAGRIYDVANDSPGLAAVRRLADKGRARLAEESATVAS